MVAVFTGLGAGFERGSSASLGAAGLLGGAQLGRGGEGVFLNAKSGNLLLQRQDEFLAGLGPDAAVVRTYNSQGALDDNGDYWRQSTDRRVYALTGTVNTTGSTITRVSADGAEIVYIYGVWSDGSYYRATDGAGAYDKLVFASGANTWTWTDGSSQIKESYEAAVASGAWRIKTQTDTDANALTFAYVASSDKLASVTTQDGASISYTWTGANITAVVTSYTDLATATAKTLTRTTYAYDASNRLISASVDLTPENASDSVVYTTTYTYQGATHLVATMTQSDGSSVAFTYDGSNRVTSIAVAAASGDTRTTGVAYFTDRTEIADPRGQVTSLYYDANGQLTKVITPPAYVGATALNTQYFYDANGNVTRITDAAGKNTDYTYDAFGNALSVTDPNGVVVTRTYDANNNVVLETRPGSTATSASTSLYTRYVYDSENHLAYEVSAEGMVCEYRYTPAGNLEYVVHYPQSPYAIGAIVPSFATMQAWRDGLTDRSTVQITQYAYDARGDMTDAYGFGAATTASVATATEGKGQTHYVYNQAGQLLSRQTTPQGTESFVYDGLGRTISATDLNGGATTIVFNDASTTTTVTTATGYVTVSTYNKAGELLSQVATDAIVAGSTTSSFGYDKNGQVRVVTDATGGISYIIYDKMGRKAADIGQGGETTRYAYDADGRLVSTVHFATTLSASQLSNLALHPTDDIDVGTFGWPAANSSDLWQWTIYDAGGRVVETIEGDGAATAYTYDAANRLVATTSFYNKLSVSGFITTPPSVVTLPAADSARDRVTRTFYDGDGRVVGTLNAEGGLTQIIYDAAGQKIQDIAYANLTVAANRAGGTLTTLLTGLADASKDVSTRYVYDGQGFLRFTIDALNRVTELVYRNGTDSYAIGVVRETIAYATALGSVADYKYATIKTAVAALASSANDRVSYNVYNSKGQMAYAVDATGAVTGFVYDLEGRVIKTTQFAVLVAMSSMGNDSDWNTNLGNWAGLSVNLANARISRNYYSARGDVLYSIDAEGYVTGATYDSEGRLYTQYRYPTKIIVTDATTITDINNAAKGTAVTTNYRYDSFGRVIDVYDGIGTQTHRTYYATGLLLTETIANGQPDAVTTSFLYDQAGHKIVEWHALFAPEQAVTNYAYDGLGNLTSVTDPRGNATNFTYDKAGRVLTQTDALGGVVSFQYDALGRSVKTIDARGNASFDYFDIAGRVTLSIDEEGYATQTTYTAFSEVASTKRNYAQTTGAAVGAPPTLTSNTGLDATTSYVYDKLSRAILVVDAESYATSTAYDVFGNAASVTHYANKATGVAIPTPNTADATTTFVYDTDGRLKQTIDAEGKSETYTLDAFGNRISVINKIGGRTDYEYDGRGLKTKESLPIAAANSSGAQVQVVNTFEYDLRGNLTKTIEGVGLVEQRTTGYAYDKLDRVISKTGDSVTIAATATSPWTTWTPVEHYSYNANGDLIEKIDAIGAKTLYWYDALGRLTTQVSPLGTLTRTSYDANGNVVESRVYETLVTVPADATGAAPTGSGNYRVTQYTYDKLGRRYATTIPNIKTAIYAGGETISTGAITTTLQYDAFGNVVKTTDPNGTVNYTYFDRVGRKTSAIDGANYRTDWVYDSNGNIISETRYATASMTPTSTTTPPAAPTTNAADRITTFDYDKMGRRVTEKRKNVAVYDNSGGTTTADSVVAYTYNGLGEVLTKTEATGDAITYGYDASGRMSSEARSSFTDYTGATVTPVVLYSYDGLGDITRMEQGIGPADRVTTYTYSAGGRLFQMRQAVDSSTADDIVHTYTYDAVGRVTGDQYVRYGTLGVEGIGTDYDLEGRVVKQGAMVIDWSTLAWHRDGDQTVTHYNAFGEVSERGLNDVYAEKFDYDGAGRLWRTNSGDGTWKYFMYDAAGNQTLLIESSGANIDNQTLDYVLGQWGGGVSTIATTNVNGLVATITVYDGRHQAIEVREPQRERNAATKEDISTTRVYNAFGEVVYETNAAGARVDYTYNTMGRLTKIESPSVAVTSESNVVTNVRPTEYRYYDASGRLVASRDANGNMTKLTLLAGTGYNGADALVTQSIAMDGGTTTTGYDIYGNARAIKDPLWSSSTPTLHVDTQSFDRAGRLIELDHAGGLNDYYQYDTLGHRTAHWNNLVGSANAERTFYDSQGRVTKTIAFGGDPVSGADASTAGDVIQYSYVWDATLATAGMATFGGWVKTTTYQNGKTLIEKSDAFNHALSRTDMAGTLTSSVYDKAGRLVQSVSAIPLYYNYYNTGRLSAVYQTTGTQFVGRVPFDGSITPHLDSSGTLFFSYRGTSYEYDALGHVTHQKLTESGSYHGRYIWNVDLARWETPLNVSYSRVISDQTALFDALGRMTSWADAGGPAIIIANNNDLGPLPTSVLATPAATRTFEYDAMGNIRHTYATVGTITSGGTISGTTTEDYWYRYDQMERMVTAKGTLSGGAIVRGATGIDTLYDLAGNRVRIYTPSVREDYTYTNAGLLATVRSAVSTATTPGALRSQYSYDLMGRILSQTDYQSDGVTVAYSRNNVIYNAKGAITSDSTTTRRGSTLYRADSTYDYGTYAASTYALGAPYQITTINYENSVQKLTSLTTNSYSWLDSVRQGGINYKPDITLSTTNTTSFTYVAVGNRIDQGNITITDGRPRNVNFTRDMMGQIIRRDEKDNQATNNSPHEVWYRYAGVELGYVGNNGTLDTDYATSIANRQASGSSNGFMTGSAVTAADFDVAYDDISSYEHGSDEGAYTVQAGDTLSSIAAALWGDASLWYKLAEINGLTGDAPLIEDTKLIVPAGVIRDTNNVATFTPYDPADVIGNVGPTVPRPVGGKIHGCGSFGQVLLALVAIAVATFVAPYATAWAANFGVGAGAATATVIDGVAMTAPLAAGGTAITGTALIAGGAIAGVAGSVASQALGVATGIQDKFSWNAVALAAIGGGVSKVGKFGIDGTGPFAAAARAAIASGLTQGIGVATGLQKQFSWAGVAGAALGAGLTNNLRGGDFASNFGRSAGSALANAAARTLIDGTDFGDNIIAALPDVIGQTIGSAVAHRLNSTGANELQSDGAVTGSNGCEAVVGQDGADEITDREPHRSFFGSLLHLTGAVLNLGLDWLGISDGVPGVSNHAVVGAIGGSVDDILVVGRPGYEFASAWNVHANRSHGVDTATALSVATATPPWMTRQGAYEDAYRERRYEADNAFAIGAALWGRSDSVFTTPMEAFGLRTRATLSRVEGVAARIGAPYLAGPSAALNDSVQEVTAGRTTGTEFVDGAVAVGGAFVGPELLSGRTVVTSTLAIDAQTGGLRALQMSLQTATDRAVVQLADNPTIARRLLSAREYTLLSQGGRTARMQYGKAVERLTAQIVEADPELSQVFSYRSRPFFSTPDFFGYDGQNLHLFDITTEGQVSAHSARTYGAALNYAIYPALPSTSVFP